MTTTHAHEARSQDGPTWRPEPGPGFGASLREFRSHLNGYTISTGVFPPVVLMFTFTVLQVQLLTAANADPATIVAWVSTSWAAGGVVGIVLSLYYKMPIAGAWSIPGFVFVGGLLGSGHTTLGEAFGAFWMSGATVLLLGVTGAMKAIVRLLPTPVILAMIAGILIKFPVNMIKTMETHVWIAVAGVLGYVVVSRAGGPLRHLPGVVGTIAFGVAAVAVTGQLNVSAFGLAFGQIIFHPPTFTLEAFLTISVPLALMVVGAENMQAIGILKATGRRPPVTSMTTISGIGGMVAAAIGSENANIAGPTTAVMNSPDAGPPEGRYVASALAGLTYVTLGLIAGTVVSLANALPGALATTLLGMVLISIVITTIKETWETGRFTVGAFFSFIIALADVSFFEIGAPFWALIGGAATSLLFELKDYAEQRRNRELGAAQIEDLPEIDVQHG
jgi:benzoate membrane transport protein